MEIANFHWLAGVIAAHPDRKINERIRLQKIIKLLQRSGLPTDYEYTCYFYGPYSESVHADIGLLKNLGLIKEIVDSHPDGNPCYSYEARKDAELPAIEPFLDKIGKLKEADSIVLELAATYDSYKEMGFDRDEALGYLRNKKEKKCKNNKDRDALILLQQLDLIDENELSILKSFKRELS